MRTSYLLTLSVILSLSSLSTTISCATWTVDNVIEDIVAPEGIKLIYWCDSGLADTSPGDAIWQKLLTDFGSRVDFTFKVDLADTFGKYSRGEILEYTHLREIPNFDLLWGDFSNEQTYLRITNPPTLEELDSLYPLIYEGIDQMLEALGR